MHAEQTRKNILIVDDEPLLRDLLVDTLEAIGYNSTAAEDGNQALAYLSKQKFDLVISDIRMPEMDGFDLLRHVRKLYPGLPVLLVSGVANTESVDYAKPDGFLSKPFRIAQIEDMISSVLRAKPQSTQSEPPKSKTLQTKSAQ